MRLLRSASLAFIGPSPELMQQWMHRTGKSISTASPECPGSLCGSRNFMVTPSENFRSRPGGGSRSRLSYKLRLRKNSMPRSNLWIPGTKGGLLQKSLGIILYLLRETFLIASLLAFASIKCSDGGKRDFILKNMARWLVVSSAVKLIRLQNRITSYLPSQARGEDADWLLMGSYRMLSDSNGEPKDAQLSSVPVTIRQVPGSGSCLFHAIAAGVLLDKSISNDDTGAITHPPMSEVMDYSRNLRAQAVETLADESGAPIFVQHHKTTTAATLVQKAARQYGVTSETYLSNMKQDYVWGGGPEIVALANYLERQIVLLEAANCDIKCDEDHSPTIYFRALAHLGPCTFNPIYILASNQGFPKTYCGKRNNHFLAVFLSAS